MKIKLKGAQTGHSLLKRKSDALSSRFRVILSKIRAAKYEMNDLLKGAALAMAQVNYAAGDISFAVREASTTGSAQFQVRTRVENVSGVQLPIFEIFNLMNSMDSDYIESNSSISSNNNNINTYNSTYNYTNTHNNTHNNTNASNIGNMNLTALSRGGQQVQKCREVNQRFLQSLLNLASLQTAFHILETVIQTTNRRVNALEYVILPKTENTITYIISELDEQDREEFFRLKKVQAKKKAKELERERERDTEIYKETEEINFSFLNSNSDNDKNIVQAFNLLDLNDDPDIIF